MGVGRWEVGSRDIIELMRDPNAKYVIREGSRATPTRHIILQLHLRYHRIVQNAKHVIRGNDATQSFGISRISCNSYHVHL